MPIKINVGGELLEIPNAIEVVWTDEKLRVRNTDGQWTAFDSADVTSIHRSQTNYEDPFTVS